MEKPILNLIKKQALNTLGLTPLAKDASFQTISSISKNIITKSLEGQYMLNPSLRLATFMDSMAFTNHLKQKIPSSLQPHLGYFLNSKVLPSMLPIGNKLSIFHPCLFQAGLKISNPKNITFSCPFKTEEGIIQASSLGIKTMVVNTADEIDKLQKLNHKFNYVWEFDEVSLEESKIIFKLLADQNILLKGLRFKEIDVSLLPEIQKIVLLGNRFGHKLNSNTFELSIDDISGFKKWKKNSICKLIGQINDLDSTKFIYCAAKVIGQNKQTKVICDKAQDVLSCEGSPINVNIGSSQWILFNPKRCLDLERISDTNTHLNFIDIE